MPVSHFHVHNQLTQLLLELPEITTALEARRSDAVARLTSLLERAEQQLLRDKLRQAADLAACRAAIAVRRLKASGRTRVRQSERQAALTQIGAIRTAIVEVVARSESELEATRPAVRHLLQLVAASGALRLGPEGDVDDLVRRIWQLASQHEQLKPLALQVRIALNQPDIHLMLANELDLADFASEKSDSSK